VEIVCYVVLCTAYFAVGGAYMALIWVHANQAQTHTPSTRAPTGAGADLEHSS
jgi:hypothetical protein